MRLKRILWLIGVASVLGTGLAWVGVQVQDALAKAQGRQGTSDVPALSLLLHRHNLNVPYVPTPQPVVEQMLKMAAVRPDDVVYDLGCGDGRIVITAAKMFGARGVGADIDPQRIRESNANARQAGVTGRVKFVRQDLFKMDLREATVVTLYLLPEVNLKLRPKLLRELRPGARIVSHDFDMGDWKPKKTLQVPADRRNHAIYYWTIPGRTGQPASSNVRPPDPSVRVWSLPPAPPNRAQLLTTIAAKRHDYKTRRYATRRQMDDP
jgi:SAM-dependent methyltransferase